MTHAELVQHADHLLAARKFREARDAYLLLAADLPHGALFWFHVARCSEVLGEYDAAKASYQQAIDAHRQHDQPDPARSYFGYGSCLFRLGNPTGALEWWRDGLTQRCDTPGAITERSQILLTLGEYERGWQDFEARRTLPTYHASVKGHGVTPKRLEPEWDGKAEGPVRVYADQGAGDAILFSRWLEQMPTSHYLQAGPPLRKLLNGFAAPPRCEWAIPLSSLPLILRAPHPIPPHCPSPWARPKNPKPRVGICWQGSNAYLNDRDRSCPVDPRPQLASSSWDLYSLQQGIDFHSPDYAWNADYLRLLDLVITVDTSTAHLAGTMGVPTILIAQAQPFWCWGIDQKRSPWYPSVRIVRRNTVHDWESAWAKAKDLIPEMLCA